MRLVIFGVGKFFSNRKENIAEDDEIVGYIDNNAASVKSIDDKKIILPQDVSSIDYDYILVMSLAKEDMIKQLIEYGINKFQILTYDEYIEKKANNHKFDFICKGKEEGKKKIVIITDLLRYNGGALAAINAAKSLNNNGYSVTITTSFVEDDILNELHDSGISIALGKMIPNIGIEEFEFFKQYDVALVNVFLMIQVACELSKIMPVLWWIHENSDRFNNYYQNTRLKYWRYDDRKMFEKARLAAVSKVAKRNFESIYGSRVNAIFPVGIVDEGIKCTERKSEIITFAIIGMIFPPKEQKLFLDAITNVIKDTPTQIVAEVVGEPKDRDYYNDLLKYHEKIPNLIFTGNLNREEITEEFKKIDVVVCASQEETLSLAIVEGLMHSKIVITTDGTGVADYIQDGKNGFVCEAGSESSLTKKMLYVINHIKEMHKLRLEARKTYEKFFTLEALGRKVELELLQTEKEFLYKS